MSESVPDDQLSYEQAREELIRVVQQLESGGTPLAESLGALGARRAARRPLPELAGRRPGQDRRRPSDDDAPSNARGQGRQARAEARTSAAQSALSVNAKASRPSYVVSPTTIVVTVGVVRTSDRVRSSGTDPALPRLAVELAGAVGDALAGVVLDELLGQRVALVEGDEDLVGSEEAELPEVAHRRLPVEVDIPLRHPFGLRGPPGRRQADRAREPGRATRSAPWSARSGS